MSDEPVGPFVLWRDYGYAEGWHPENFATLDEAVKADHYVSRWVITRAPLRLAAVEASEEETK